HFNDMNVDIKVLSLWYLRQRQPHATIWLGRDEPSNPCTKILAMSYALETKVSVWAAMPIMFDDTLPERMSRMYGGITDQGEEGDIWYRRRKKVEKAKAIDLHCDRQGLISTVSSRDIPLESSLPALRSLNLIIRPVSSPDIPLEINHSLLRTSGQLV
ncbi:hypothetical protein J1614_007176, partial [Plenodomus biglobosus]